MVIVHLMGGLGNQMFQYAMGRALAHRLDTILKLDINAYAHNGLRTYSLSPFSIQDEFASQTELAAIRRPYESRIAWYLLRLSQTLHLPYGWRVLQENHLRPYDPRLAELSGHLYLKGYWQSENYFAHMRGLIQQEFTVRNPPDPLNRAMAEQIADVQSVSLHIRRGDYVSNPDTHHIHGVCSLAYYHTCVQRMAERIVHPHFFVFSDDPAWAEKNLHLAYPVTFVNHNSGAPHEDLRLMSLCQHHIIANSTFSWWGAWLSRNPDKIVFAPRRWFNDPTIDTSDLLPKDWIQV